MGEGKYTVTVTALGDQTAYSDSLESEKSDPQEVTRRTGVQYLWWIDNSAQARWVTTLGPANYAVQLYKDETAVGSPVTVPRDDDTSDPGNASQKVTTHDFAAAIRTSGAGSYKFTVTAKGDDLLVLDSEPVILTSPKLFTVPTVSAAVLELAGTDQAVLKLTFDEAVTIDGSAPYGFTLSDSSVTVTGLSSSGSASTHTFTLSTPAGADAVTLVYSGNAVKNAYGISPTDFSGTSAKSVTKKLAAPTPSLSDQGVASWTALSSATYFAQLYKDEIAQGGLITGISGTTYSFLSAMRSAGVGIYTVKISASLAGYENSGESEASNSQKVDQPANVSVSWWDGNTAKWVNVAVAKGYSVQLYKNDSTTGESGLVSTGIEGTLNGSGGYDNNGVDLSEEMNTLGNGVYTFKARAKGDDKLILDSSAESAASSEKNWIKLTAGTNLFGTSQINAITWNGSNVYVAVGSGGKIAYSADGATWTLAVSTPFNTANVLSVAYGNGKFVAGGVGGLTAYSSDGINWSAVTGWSGGTILDGQDVVGLVYSNGKFAAVGDRGKTAYSTTGNADWTWAANIFGDNPGQNDYITGMTNTNGELFALAQNNAYFPRLSNNNATWDNVTWINSSFHEGTGVNDIAYGNSIYVAVGNNGKISTSTDGSNWTLVTTDVFGISGILRVTWANGKFIAVGHDGKIAESANGSTWKALSQSSFHNRTQIRSILYDNSKFIFGGNRYGEDVYQSESILATGQ
jgi:hypothetical protein